MAHAHYNAWISTAVGQPLKWGPVEDSSPLADDWLELKVTHCGICATDVGWINNEYGMSSYPAVCGHEVVGVVSAVGKQVKNVALGDKVACSNVRGSCLTCSWCVSGRDNLCPNSQWLLLKGGFGEFVRMQSTFVFPLPSTLPPEAVAPLMCAGATVYAPLVVNNVRAGQRVGVVGIGGLGHLALQFARAWGCEVTAISRGTDKEAESRKFGAHHFLNTSEREAALKSRLHYFDFLLVTVNKEIDWSFYLSLLNKDGTLCVVGLPGGTMTIPTMDLVIRQLHVVGGAGCSRAHYREMLQFAEAHSIRPAVEVLPATDIQKGLERVHQNKARYRVVLQY